MKITVATTSKFGTILKQKEFSQISFEQIKKAFPYFSDVRVSVMEALLNAEEPLKFIFANVLSRKENDFLCLFTSRLAVNGKVETVNVGKLFVDLIDNPKIARFFESRDAVLTPVKNFSPEKIINSALAFAVSKILEDVVYSPDKVPAKTTPYNLKQRRIFRLFLFRTNKPLTH